MFVDYGINRNNLDEILRALGKQFRKLNGKKTPAEIVLVGGAAIIANYGFREATNDIDAIICASSALQDAAALIEDDFGLEHNWLNSDFRRTDSYSTKLVQHSKYYRTFSNILQVRIVDAEYLVAMKLVAGREEKNDLKDIIGIVAEEIEKGNPITYEKVDAAMNELYDGWENVNPKMISFFEAVLSVEEPFELYEEMKLGEAQQKVKLLDFEDDLEI